MDDQIVLSVTSVTSYLNSVNLKVSSLVKTTHDPTLLAIHGVTIKLRSTLQSLNNKLHHPGSKLSVLAGVKNQDGTLFQYINNAMTATIGTLRELTTAIKNMKSGPPKPSLFSRKGSTTSERKPSTVTDTDLLVFREKIHVLDLILQAAVQMIEIHQGTEATLLVHLHGLKHHIKSLEDLINQMKTCSLNVAPAPSDAKAKLSSPDIAALCSKSIDFATHQCSSDESEMTRRHSGFVPMAPLVEVNTNNTVMANFDDDDF